MTTNLLAAYPDLHLVEFHDALLDRVVLFPRASADLEFRHIAVYRRETPNTCGVWSFPGVLRVDGVRSFAGDGYAPSMESNWVSAADFYDAAGTCLDTAPLERGERLAIASLDLVFTTGARILFHASNARLELGEPIERFETYRDDVRS